jgi:hypothetical protein
MARFLSDTRPLGASFFFERGDGDRGNAKKLFPTIARQLAINSPFLLPKMREAIHDNPDIAEKGMREQFDKLILKPLQKLDTLKQDDRSNVSSYIKVIVIDALDECREIVTSVSYYNSLRNFTTQILLHTQECL